MRERSARDSTHFGIVQTMILALLIVAVTSCTTTPATGSVPEDAEPAGRAVAESRAGDSAR